MLYIAYINNRATLDVDEVDMAAKSRKWWNEGAKPKGIRTVGIFGALGTDAKDVLIFEAEDHEEIEQMVEYWRNEVDLEIHPALDLAQRWRVQGMKIE